MTFCSFWKDCVFGDTCERALTVKVQNAAEEWIKDAPICQYTSKPECHKRKETECQKKNTLL